jgi:acetolactate synthase-1/3 small subunit
VDVSPEGLVIEATGTEEKIDSLVEMLRPYTIVEMVRTGRVVMARGSAMANSQALRSKHDKVADQSDVSLGSV